MAGRPRDLQLRKTRKESARDAAMKLFAEKGFQQTTMKDICEEAGTSPGALYRYFTGKDDIILAIADLDAQDVQKLILAIEEAPDLVSAIEERVDDIIDWRIDAVSARLRIEFTAEALRNPSVAEAFQAADDRLRACLEAAIRRDIDAGRIRNFTPEALAFLVQSIFEGIGSRAAFGSHPQKDSLAASLKALISLLKV